MSFKKWSLLIIGLTLVGCSQQNKDSSQQAETIDKYTPFYEVLQAHGGIEGWRNQQTLSFEMGDQKHTVDLKSREIKVTTPNYSMGNDDGTVWLKQDSMYFQGSPRFSHSLMFYFHTMPFVLADDGINYQEVPDKEIKGVVYKGVKMTFDEHVGDAPKDQYILYYHPESHKMEWLAYSSTFHSRQRSDNFNMIHYKAWKETNGFLLPTELQWYEYENGEVGAPSGDPRIFTNKKLSKEKMNAGFFDMPESAVVDSAEVN